MKTLVCNCNGTMPLAAEPLARALAATPGASAGGLDKLHTLLCRREAPLFQRAAKATTASADELLVACTQEQRLFLELNEQTEGCASVQERPIRFVNIRETGGWSRDAGTAMPKIAALIAAAQAPEPAAVASVGYRSSGRCLIVGPAAAAESAAALLDDGLELTLLTTPGGPARGAAVGAPAVPQSRMRGLAAGAPDVPQARMRDVQALPADEALQLRGWLGAFRATWQLHNPIDLDLCTRCNACIAACPEGAISLDWQVDLALCTSHRECVRVCDAAGAIDFERAPRVEEGEFDLVLDLRAEPAFVQHAPPLGYHHVADPAALLRAVGALRAQVGEFDKPKFFHYRPELCAHSRNERIGCRNCIDICSAAAIRSDASLKGKGAKGAMRGSGAFGQGLPKPQGGGVIVEPHLCVGCGACSSVCPSGAMGFAYPSPADLARRLTLALGAYARAGGRDAALLLHGERAGAALIDALGRAAQRTRPPHALHGVPARVLPLSLWHAASTGIEFWLAAIARGASQVWVLVTDEDAPAYRSMLHEQMAVAQALLSGLGYAGRHFAVIEAAGSGALPDAAALAALDVALRAAPAQTVARAATSEIGSDKRSTLEAALEHLLVQAPSPEMPEAIALPAARPAAGAAPAASTSPLGSIEVNAERCTMCLACVGACPSGALLDNPERPQLRFIEKNCVQCGLCANTCPEDAITLQPRWWLADAGRARKQARVLHEVPPFACVRCGKPFGTLRAVEAMAAKLAGHAAFQGAAAQRLKMCGDCRVIDLHSDAGEVRITDL